MILINMNVLMLCSIVIFLLWAWSYRRYLKLYWTVGTKYPALPFVGHGHLFLGSREDAARQTLTFCDHAIANGGLSAIWYLHRLYLMVADALDAEFILKNHVEKDPLTSVIRLVFRTSHIFAPVAVWRPRRRTLSSLLSFKNVNKFEPVFAENSETLVQQLRPLAGQGAFSIWEHFNALAVDTACTTIIGKRLKSQTNLKDPIRTATNTLVDIAGDMLRNILCFVDFIAKRLDVYKRLLRQDQVIRDFVQKALKKHEDKMHESDTAGITEQQPSSVLRMWMQLKQEVDPSMLHDEALGLLLGASDTTAISASVVSVMLANRPDVQEKAYQELIEVFGGSNRPVNIEDLPRLKYLEAVIKESLRLYPPIPHITRTALVDTVLPSGVMVPKGVSFQISIYALNRNPKYWGADADQFRPERFLDGSVPEETTLFAFSYGPRGCLGAQYASMSLKVSIATLLRQYRLLPAAAGDEPLRPLFGLTMMDAGGFRVKIQARNANI